MQLLLPRPHIKSLALKVDKTIATLKDIPATLDKITLLQTKENAILGILGSNLVVVGLPQGPF